YVVEQSRIDDRAGHGPRRVERRGERQYAVGADPADRRLESGEAAARGRQPNGAAGVGADRPWRKPGGDRYPRAAARPAWGARDLGVPRVPGRAAMLVGPPAAHCKLDRVGFANDNKA